ncbi:gliding motility-associated ABC transporter substrate-binding protein GldG [Urechidicola sp. KH5]
MRFDLTKDKRYTLSKAAVELLEEVDKTVTITVFLEGEFPSEFKRLQIETQQLLEEFRAINRNISFRFEDPTEDAEALANSGLTPSQLSVQENGKVSEHLIFPWAVVEVGNKFEKVSLLKDSNADSQEAQLENAIQNLEYAFADAIHKVTNEKQQRIAVLKSNGTLDDIFLYDFLNTIKNYYHLAPFTLDSVKNNAKKTLLDLQQFDLVLVAKPTERFTEKEKYVLDQYYMNGGNTLWLLDNVAAELDSLKTTGETLAFNRDLNLTDLFFNYGIRINPNIVDDMYSATIPLATGNIGNQTQYSPFLWPYYPLLQSQNNHVINKHIEPVRGKFMSSIDTLKSSSLKTILLQSSPLSKTIGVPSMIELSRAAEQPKPESYNTGNLPVAVLVEEQVKSAYADRVLPFENENHLNNGANGKIVIISDGDLIANEIQRGQPISLATDKYTGQFYGNKDFLLNTINYLLDDSGLIQVRNKTVDLKVLNRELAYSKRNYYQFLNLLAPLITLTIFGFIFNMLRRNRYK